MGGEQESQEGAPRLDVERLSASSSQGLLHEETGKVQFHTGANCAPAPSSSSPSNQCRLPPIDTPRPLPPHYKYPSRAPLNRLPLFKSNSLPVFTNNYNTSFGRDIGSTETDTGSAQSGLLRGNAGRYQMRNLLDSPSSFTREHETRFAPDPHRVFSPVYQDMVSRRMHPYASTERKNWDNPRCLSRTSAFNDSNMDESIECLKRRLSYQPSLYTHAWNRSFRPTDQFSADFQFRRPNLRYSRMPGRQYMSWTENSHRGYPGSFKDPIGTSFDEWHQHPFYNNGSTLLQTPQERLSTNSSVSKTLSDETSTHEPKSPSATMPATFSTASRPPDNDAHGHSVSTSSDRSPIHDTEGLKYPSVIKPAPPGFSHDQHTSQFFTPKNQYQMANSEQPVPPKRGGKLPKHITDMLKTWLLDHADHPYPTEEEKRVFCDFTGLDICQISNWFVNARRRILVPQSSRAAPAAPAPS